MSEEKNDGNVNELEEIPNAVDLLDDGSVVVDKFYAAEAGGIECVLGQDLVIRGLAERNSLFAEGTGVYYTVTADAQKKGKGTKTERIGFNTGSAVLIKQLQQLQGRLPVHATIEKVKAKGSSGYYYYQIQQGAHQG